MGGVSWEEGRREGEEGSCEMENGKSAWGTGVVGRNLEEGVWNGGREGRREGGREREREE